MSSTVIRMRSRSTSQLKDLSHAIINGSNMAGAELVLEQLREVNDVRILLLVFEKFYLRNNSMTAITIQIIDNSQEQSAVIVGTGGGDGLLNISMGANKNFACKAAKTLAILGFEEIQPQ